MFVNNPEVKDWLYRRKEWITRCWRYATSSKYRRTWGSKVGRDCISLETSLCRWLGARLLFLAENASGYPMGYKYADWTADLKRAGEALTTWGNRYEQEDWDKWHDKEDYARAQEALQWVATNLGNLWD